MAKTKKTGKTTKAKKNAGSVLKPAKKVKKQKEVKAPKKKLEATKKAAKRQGATVANGTVVSIPGVDKALLAKINVAAEAKGFSTRAAFLRDYLSNSL